MIVFAVLILLFILYKKLNKPSLNEGFSQNERFVLKRDSDAYDEFYVKIYDTLHLPENKVNSEMKMIVDMTQASEKSAFLDIGSGTGHLVNSLQSAGYRAYGIDKSKAMVSQSTDRFPHIHTKCGDVSEPMAFEKNRPQRIGRQVRRWVDNFVLSRNPLSRMSRVPRTPREVEHRFVL